MDSGRTCSFDSSIGFPQSQQVSRRLDRTILPILPSFVSVNGQDDYTFPERCRECSPGRSSWPRSRRSRKPLPAAASLFGWALALGQEREKGAGRRGTLTAATGGGHRFTNMKVSSPCPAMYAALFAFQGGRTAMRSRFRVSPLGRSRIIDVLVSSRGPCTESTHSA